ncbi:viroplasmin family protein [Tissierella praeacuta]|uniref:ribonuclease H1 domain-containing protein n=1 Tax=Tissierella praeacuta TaxID=43131 RepID=UPI001C109BAC|nr:ribonuclease H family protein [Tissierella praeacuta]MBU5256808.1 ribonuclease H family protein [Tissierella praeacuta]
MSRNKYYAVRKGRNVGVFTSWKKCKESITGFSGAEYKGFQNLDDANKFLLVESEERENEQSDDIIQINEDEVIAYVDGSYDDSLKAYGSGVVIIHANNKIETFKNSGNDMKYVEMRNVAGEVLASVFAMKYAVTNKFKKLYLYFDYEGIEKWCTGEWKANKEGTRAYKKYYDEVSKILKVKFIKVKAHSGNTYNDEADKLAKSSLTTFVENDKTIESTISNNGNNVDSNLLNVLYKIANSNEISKNTIVYRFGNLDLTERKLIKFVKEVWKVKGSKVKDIDKISMRVDAKELSIEWEIRDKSGADHSFKYKF